MTTVTGWACWTRPRWRTWDPDYNILVIRDAGSEPGGIEFVDGPLAEFAIGTLPSGTLANAGRGWIHARAGGDRLFHHVRLEVHDAEPDWPEFDAAIQAPFVARSAKVELASLTFSATGPSVALPRAGLFRVRLVKRCGSGRGSDPDGRDGNRWLFQFWPVDGPPGLPRWIRRDEPVGPNSDDMLVLASDVAATAAWSNRATFAVSDLAERLLVDPAAVRGAVRSAVGRQMISCAGDIDRDEQLTLSVRDAMGRSNRGDFAFDDAGPVSPATMVQSPLPRHPYPFGPPPRHGWLVPRRGELYIGDPSDPLRPQPVRSGVSSDALVAVPSGIVRWEIGLSDIVRCDGSVESLPNHIVSIAFDQSGRYLAASTMTFGRHPKFGLQWIDLETLDIVEVPWDPAQRLTAVEVHRDGRLRWVSDANLSAARPMVWDPRDPTRPPGIEPDQFCPVRATFLEPGLLVEHAEFDQASGRYLLYDYDRHLIIREPGGAVRELGITEHWNFVPGGQYLYRARLWEQTPAVSVADLDGEVRLHVLPAEFRHGHHLWEDAATLLVSGPATPPELLDWGRQVLRLNIHTGDVEWAACGSADEQVTLIRPFRADGPG